MHIERIEIERCGALAQLTIDSLGPGVQVLHGTNEIGKTSLLEFVRAIFFGFGGLFRRGVLDPQLPCAGRLWVRMGPDSQLFSIERRHEGPQLAWLTRASYENDGVGLGDNGDVLTISEMQSPADGHGQRRVFLQDLIGGIDEKTFTNVMAFGLDELHELKTLEPEGCGSRLYELASGLDRSKVARVLAHLRAAIGQIDSADPSLSPIASLQQQRQEVTQRLAALQAPALAAGRIVTALVQLDGEIAALQAAIATAEQSEAVVRGVMHLEPLSISRRDAAERLAALMSGPLVHEDLNAWKRAQRRRRRCNALSRKRKRTRSRLARELAAVPVESIIWKKRAAITGLCDEIPRLERLVSEVSRSQSQAHFAARRFGEQVGSAGLARLVPLDRAADGDENAPSAVLLPDGFARSFGPLRARARECASATHEVLAARRLVAEAKSALDDTHGLVKGAGPDLNGLTISEAIEEASSKATSLRNRFASGEQIVELDRSLTKLEKEMLFHRDTQLIPIGWLLGLGFVFVIGAGMLLAGIFLPATITGSLAYCLAALGLAGTGLASVTTWSLDRAAAQRLDATRRQCDMVRRQRDEALTQCGSLDKRIPPDATISLERRALVAQAEVERLEALAAREGSIHVLADKVTVAEQSLDRALTNRKAARLRWRRALQHRGLPDSLLPADVRRISSHRHTLLVLDDDRRRLSDEARQKREELNSFSQRIDQLLVECDLLPNATPLDHLHQLRERLDAETLATRRYLQIEKRLQRARVRHRKALREVQRMDRTLQSFLLRWDAATEKDFLAMVDRRQESEQARHAAEAAEAAWVVARRKLAEPIDLERWLAESTLLPLAQRLADACAATESLRSELSVVETRAAAQRARVAAGSRDRSTEGLQNEIAAIDQQLAMHSDRRCLLQRAQALLVETRATLARDHQPPALRDASHWLSRLTAGRYTHITTTIDEARLEVHAADGEAWNPERLSRGTREQVFLALRLALVRDLQRHGILLPVIMDDALVNFDDDRAAAAARVLCEFVADQPAQRQMLVLTCHAHVAEIFSRAGAAVQLLGKTLPASERPARRQPRRDAVQPVVALQILTATPEAPEAPEAQEAQEVSGAQEPTLPRSKSRGRRTQPERPL